MICSWFGVGTLNSKRGRGDLQLARMITGDFTSHTEKRETVEACQNSGLRRINTRAHGHRQSLPFQIRMHRDISVVTL